MTGYTASGTYRESGKGTYKEVRPDYTKVRGDDVPEDAEIFVNSQWYKIGLHNFLYVLREENTWKRASLDPLDEKKVMKSINDRRPRSRRVKLG
jgi:hypothetical protein